MKNRINGLIVMVSVVFLFGSKFSYASASPSNPILVLGSDKNFGTYTTEILKTEGFNEFQIEPFRDAKVTVNYLKQFDVVILTETILTRKQSSVILAYVKGGGNLIAFKPDSKLNDLFGVTGVEGGIDASYIGINPGEEISKGLTTETIQLHGEASKLELKNGKKIAAFYKDGMTQTEYPAVVSNDFGKCHAIAF